MARLVIPKSNANGYLAGAGARDRPADGYSDRLIKYVPAEAVAFYACVDREVSSHFGINSTASSISQTPPEIIILSGFLFLLGLIGTPFYLYNRKISGQPWKMNVVISTIAFPLWAYTLGGSLFVIIGCYSTFFAGLLAPIFTFVAGWFEPASE